MSRRDPGRGTPRRASMICRVGKHRWGAEQSVGAGILRRVCSVCGSVTIDLTRTEGSSQPLPEGSRRISSLDSSH